MRRLVALTSVALLAGTGLAAADPIQRVDDPSGQFNGHYDCSYYTYDASGAATKHTRSCEQKGYVAVYSDGVEACNGNEAYKRPDDGSALQGYVWIGPAHAAKNPSASAPAGAFGAGDNLPADAAGTKSKAEAHGPCADSAPPHE
jgi:hypothetical protein